MTYRTVLIIALEEFFGWVQIFGSELTRGTANLNR
jgi:hypothetical protein